MPGSSQTVFVISDHRSLGYPSGHFFKRYQQGVDRHSYWRVCHRLLFVWGCNYFMLKLRVKFYTHLFWILLIVEIVKVHDLIAYWIYKMHVKSDNVLFSQFIFYCSMGLFKSVSTTAQVVESFLSQSNPPFIWKISDGLCAHTKKIIWSV